MFKFPGSRVPQIDRYYPCPLIRIQGVVEIELLEQTSANWLNRILGDESYTNPHAAPVHAPLSSDHLNNLQGCKVTRVEHHRSKKKTYKDEIVVLHITSPFGHKRSVQLERLVHERHCWATR
jgi:hypothetical protein